MPTYYIKLTFEAPSIVTFKGKEVFRLKCTASDAVAMPEEIFCHQKTLVDSALAVAQDEFTHICSPYELSLYPVDEPATGQFPAFFRKNKIDILLPGIQIYDETKASIESQVRRLLDLMERLDTLSGADEVSIPTAPPDNSSSLPDDSSSEVVPPEPGVMLAKISGGTYAYAAGGNPVSVTTGFEPSVVMPFSIWDSGSFYGGGAFAFGASKQENRVSFMNYLFGVNPPTSVCYAFHNIGMSAYQVSTVYKGSSPRLEPISMTPTGFTSRFQINNTGGSARYHFLSLGNLASTLITAMMPPGTLEFSNSPNYVFKGSSAEPNSAVIYMSVYLPYPDPTLGGAIVPKCQTSIGFWTPDAQHCVAVYSADNVSPTVTRRAMYNDASLAFINTSSIRKMTTTVAQTGNTLYNQFSGSDTTTAYYWGLVLSGCLSKSGTFDCAGSLSPLTISCPGIVPKVFLFVMAGDTKDNMGVIRNDLMLNIGACDGTTTFTTGILDRNGLAGQSARSYQSGTTMVEYNVSGTKQFEATVAFGSESVTITPTLNLSASFGQGMYLILGDAV